MLSIAGGAISTSNNNANSCSPSLLDPLHKSTIISTLIFSLSCPGGIYLISTAVCILVGHFLGCSPCRLVPPAVGFGWVSPYTSSETQLKLQLKESPVSNTLSRTLHALHRIMRILAFASSEHVSRMIRNQSQVRYGVLQCFLRWHLPEFSHQRQGTRTSDNCIKAIIILEAAQ
jgi:hypothetical protein